jgi:MerR family redox-sensitive transcriptional activator SoxR
MQKELTIGEVAHFAGIEASAIRYYESMGLLPLPKRVNGRRRYDVNVLKRLGLIQLVRQAGFGIRETQVLFGSLNLDAPGSIAWQALAAEKIAQMEEVIERTQAAKMWLEEALKSECKGVEDCVTMTFDENSNGMKVNFICGEMKIG